MVTALLISTIVILTLTCVAAMLYRLKQQPAVALSFVDYIKLSISGIVAFIADTLGIGSFAVNVAMAKTLKTFPDEELPAMNNGAQVIPGAIESLFFMHMVEVDLTTLLTLVAGTCFGGLIGGYIVSGLNKQPIRLIMIICFTLLIGLLGCHKLQLMPIGGNLVALPMEKLILGFIGLTICGALTSAGIGLFVMVQSVLFLLQVSPLVAFPIMMVAGAMQQPLTTLVFVQQNKIPLKKTLILSLAGCIGVFVTVPLFVKLTPSLLHSLLLMILIYNLFAISQAYWRSRSSGFARSTTEPAGA